MTTEEIARDVRGWAHRREIRRRNRRRAADQ